jgi:hypothetical protein
MPYIVTTYSATPEAEPRGILLIKKVCHILYIETKIWLKYLKFSHNFQKDGLG